MDDWEKFNGTSLPEKEDFYIYPNMEDITDADYMHRKRVCKDFEIKNLGAYHDLYVQSDTLILGGVFSNFWNIYLEIWARSSAWQAALRMTKSKIRSIDWY